MTNIIFDKLEEFRVYLQKKIGIINKVIWGIILLIIFILVVLKYRRVHNSQRIFIKSSNNLQKYSKTIRYDSIPDSKEKLQFAYSVWVYLDNTPNHAKRQEGSDKFYPILSKRHSDYINGSPGLYYKPETAQIMITMKTNQMNKYPLDHIDIQKWINIVIVLEDRSLDVYINGKLYRSLFLDNVADIGKGDLYVGKKKSSIYGDISYLRYFNHSLTSHQVEKLYNETNKNDPSPGLLWWLTSP